MGIEGYVAPVPPPADYGVWAALFDVKERKRLEILICSILAGIQKRVIDGSNWSSIEDRRRPFIKRMAEEERMKIEKEQRKAERLRQQHTKLARLRLIPQEPSPDNFDLEPLMQWALEAYGDWRRLIPRPELQPVHRLRLFEMRVSAGRP